MKQISKYQPKTQLLSVQIAVQPVVLGNQPDFSSQFCPLLTIFFK